MAGPVKVRINTSEFTATLNRYAAVSKRTPAEICDKKAYYVLRRATWYTDKVSPETIRSELGETKAMELVKTKRGKWSRSKKNIKSFFSVPLLALIIQARRSLAGKPSVFAGVSRAAGAQRMLEAMRKVFNARMRSIAFIKSGWIEARDKFKAKVGGGGKGLPPNEKASIGGPKVIGSSKGGATLASPVWRAKSVFWNSAAAKRDPMSLADHAIPALQTAFDEENDSTAAEVEKRLKENARECGMRVQ